MAKGTIITAMPKQLGRTTMIHHQSVAEFTLSRCLSERPLFHVLCIFVGCPKLPCQVFGQKSLIRLASEFLHKPFRWKKDCRLPSRRPPSSQSTRQDSSSRCFSGRTNRHQNAERSGMGHTVVTSAEEGKSSVFTPSQTVQPVSSVSGEAHNA